MPRGFPAKDRLPEPTSENVDTLARVKNFQHTNGNWLARAINYANWAVDSEQTCKWTKKAAKRFLSDLELSKKNKAPFKMDERQASRACCFIECLPHVEGKWGTKNIKLEDFQVFILVNLFGFRLPDGRRRFTSFLLAIARKNGKSTFAAAIGLYCLTLEDEEGPQVISAATTGDQAKIVFNFAQRMVNRRKDIQLTLNLEAYVREIKSFDNGGSYKPINAKASTQDGLNPSCVILDEIHAHKSYDLLNVLQSAAGARRNPLYLFITTEGYETPGPWPEMRKFAKQILNGAVEADHYFALIFTIDDKDDEFEEKNWYKANPLLCSNEILLNEIRKESEEAKSMPGRHAEFLIKRVNRQSATPSGWIDLVKWRACEGEVSDDFLKNYPCYAGFDLASTRDITAFSLVWYIEKILYVKGWYFVPQTTVLIRAQRNLVPYTGWIQGGNLIETPGEVTDYDTVFGVILDAMQSYNILKCAYDTWNASQLAAKIEKEGMEMVPFIQGPKSYHPPMKFFEETYLDGRFRHGGDPVLTWMASNIVPRRDANMNMAPDKKKSADKIDGMTSLLMATGIMIKELEDEGNLDLILDDPLILK